MLLKQVLGHEDILQFVANTGPNIADKMTFVEMLLDLIVILVVYVLKLGEVFLTNFAFQMCWDSQVSAKSIDIIITGFAEVTPRMVED